MFLIRGAGSKDFKQVFALAKALNSYNLPAERAYIRRLLAVSEQSFRGRVSQHKAQYLFVLEKRPGHKLIGCSLIIAQHGTATSPHFWLAQKSIVRRSRSLGMRRKHKVLQLGKTCNGPTEVGGLVVLPQYRQAALRCGLQLSFVRFLYMAMHPGRFDRVLLVEFRGEMSRQGSSLFWDRLGRVFTGLSYNDADRLSVKSKEFIVGLLPSEPIYCALLPDEVQASIGKIHPAAQRAARLLAGVGFKPLNQVEPFDGGPYHAAVRNQVRVVRRTRRVTLSLPKKLLGRGRGKRAGAWVLAGTEAGGSFRAVLAPGKISGDRCRLDPEAYAALKVDAGERLYAYAVSR